MEKSQIEQSFDEIVEFSGIAKFIETEVKFYSSGMFLRLAFSVATVVWEELMRTDFNIMTLALQLNRPD